jgi:ribosomal protein L21
MYAVLELSGRQYIVKKGDTIVVDRMNSLKEGDVFDVDKVLMVFDEEGENVKI